MPFHRQTVVEYVGRDDFNKLWINMTRQIHIMTLAKPKTRMIQQWPDPNLIQELPVEVPLSALKFKTTKRLKLLSRYNPMKFSPKFTPTQPSEHYVETHTLVAVPSKRLIELAKPRKIPKKDKKSKKKSLKRKRKEKKFKNERNEWLKLRAAPRKIPQPTKFHSEKKKSLKLSREELEKRLIILSTPIYKIKDDRHDPFAVSPTALKYKITKRMTELALPRELPEEALLDLQYNPFTVSKAALTYKTTPQILKLAVPFVRKQAVDTDVKEDPFGVPPRALKAICTKRTKELARPIQRD